MCVKAELGECVYEEEVAKCWWDLPQGSILPISTGAVYTLVFAGTPGGACGPDVRDAVFRVTYRPLLSVIRPEQFPQTQITGDVEFHIRSADWFAHGHQRDERYNHVVLHVVFVYDRMRFINRQDGVVVPTYCIQDTIRVGPQRQTFEWPCRLLIQTGEAEVEQRLRLAGEMRFEQKMHTLVEALHTQVNILAESVFSLYDQVLIVRLAEGLGYGRNRGFFWAVGYALVYEEAMPERAAPSPLDAIRLRVLERWVEQWRILGAWKTFQEVLHSEPSGYATLQRLRKVLCASGLSLARADILICNVILPFAAAIGLIERDLLLYEKAFALYREHPSLSENWVTRVMCQQLGLKKLPEGSRQQQGLQHIYQQTCREKRCEECILGKRRL